MCVGMDSHGGGQPGQFCNFPAQDPGPGRPPGAGQALRWPGGAQGDGTVPRVEAAWGHRGSSWPLTGGPGHNLPWPRPWQLLTLGSTRRGVLRLMKDFMMLPWGVEVGVMSIWFLCTVCRKVRRGRTTCRWDQRQAPGAGQTDQGQTLGGGTEETRIRPQGRDRGDQGQTPGWGRGAEGGQTCTHLAGRTGRGGGLAPGGLQLLILQLLLLVQLIHRLLIAALPPAEAWRQRCQGAGPGVLPSAPATPQKRCPLCEQNWAQPPRLQPERYRRGESP